MDILAQGLDPTGEPGVVRLQEPVPVPLMGLPAVVHVDISEMGENECQVGIEIVKFKKSKIRLKLPKLTKCRASAAIVEGPGFKSRLGHHYSMVLSSLSGSWHYPCSVKNVQEMAAPSKI